MDYLYFKNRKAKDSNIYLIMDNDSGYVSNNLDQESNSDSILDSSSTSTVDILRSFIPKPVYLSEDALLERPDAEIFSENKDFEYSLLEDTNPESLSVIADSSTKSVRVGLPSFNSFDTDAEVSDSSLVIPVADPIYFDLNTKVHSSPSIASDIVPPYSDIQEEFKQNNEPLESVAIDHLTQPQKSDREKTMEQEKIIAEPIPHEKIECSQKNHCYHSIPNDSHSYLKRDNFRSPCKTKNSDVDEKICSQTTILSSRSVTKTPSKVPFGSNSDSNILSNVTNICDKSNSACKVTLRRRTNSTKDKENITQSEVFKTPSKGLKRKFDESQSPDLFSDDENCKLRASPLPKIIEERFVHKLDQRLLKRVQKELSGVPPPPDFTITKFTVDDILEKLEVNKHLFITKDELPKLKTDKLDNIHLNENKYSSFGCNASILIDGEFEEVEKMEFPKVLNSRHHGLHHNRNKLSEEIEYLCEKYARRYIGAETQSTCCAVDTKYISPAKRKGIRPKWVTKSPGRRLSHLAKRRITFSAANLQGSSSSSAASRARQILIDYKKLELLNRKKSPRKSPRKTPRKTPNKSPGQGRTPSSSAKKKLRMRFRLLSGDFKDAVPGPSSSIAGSKRALFQSPDNENKFRNILSNSSMSSCSSFNSDLSGKLPKRSLFSSPSKTRCTSLFSLPGKRSPFKNISAYEKKRKRDESDDNISNPSKLFRSQSTGVGVPDSDHKTEQWLSRTKSEGGLNTSGTLTDLSAAHKKKLQWAVYESLKIHNITTTHPQFKTFASVLARVTRRFILASNVRLEGGTSERMLRIARHNSYAVVKGKSVEEIMGEHSKNKPKTSKLQGYIGPEDYYKFLNRESTLNKANLLKDKGSTGESKISSSQPRATKPESRIDRIRKVINFEDNR